jgi:hypothetical protein
VGNFFPGNYEPHFNPLGKGGGENIILMSLSGPFQQILKKREREREREMLMRKTPGLRRCVLLPLALNH